MMPLALRVLVAVVCLSLTSLVEAQQSNTPAGLLGAALAALGATSIQTGTLTGNSELVSGTSEESGSFIAQCSVDGSSQLQLSFSSGSRTEIRKTTNGFPSGSWIDSQGVSHAMAGHNVFTPESWFCPHIVLSRLLLNPNLNIQNLGQESKNGISVLHFVIAPIPKGSARSSLLTAHLSTLEIYLDSASLRPVSLNYNFHPDNSATVDIPVEIQFGGFNDTSGVWTPGSIEQYVNSTLVLKLQVESATSL
jgi:hypothetical protein